MATSADPDDPPAENSRETSPALGGYTRGLAGASVLLALVTIGFLLWPLDDPERATAAPSPKGPPGEWVLAFSDEFTGQRVDWSRWADHSSAEEDDGHGNKKNDQLEWNHADNCRVRDGLLTMTARPDRIRSPAGKRYRWSSCLIRSRGFAFRYGYLEARARFPAKAGFWPGFWTWQAPGRQEVTETDVYEFYSHAPDKLYLTQHSGSGGECELNDLGFDPTSGFHRYGAEIRADGWTHYYIDGHRVCRVKGTSTGRTNVMVSMFVYALRPPRPGTIARHQVDYVRVWQRR